MNLGVGASLAPSCGPPATLRPVIPVPALHTRPSARRDLSSPHLPAPPQDATDRELSLIEQLLPNEMLLLVFAQLPLSSLGAVALVSRQWRGVAAAPSLWRAACADAFALCPAEVNERLLFKFHRGSWRDMYLDRPHLRFDGLYVARNTYVRMGATEWRARGNPVHLVAYYRYCRFFPDGTFLYRTTPEAVGKVARTLATRSARQHAANGVQAGRYRLDGERLATAMRYDNSTSTEVRARLRLRSTTRGAHNRLDIESIVSYDREDGSSVPMTGPPGPDDEEEEGDGGGDRQRRYSRGLAPYVFVPWEQVATHVLNLSVDKMDVYIPG